MTNADVWKSRPPNVTGIVCETKVRRRCEVLTIACLISTLGVCWKRLAPLDWKRDGMIVAILRDLHTTLVCEGKLPPIGFERRKFRYIVELGQDGSCLGVAECAPPDSGDQWFTVPVDISHTSKGVPNLLYGNCEYVLGLVETGLVDERYLRLVRRSHLAFRRKLKAFALAAPYDVGVQATLRFYENGRSLAVACARIGEAHPPLSAAVTFRLHGDREIILERAVIRSAVVAALSGLRRPCEESGSLRTAVCPSADRRDPQLDRRADQALDSSDGAGSLRVHLGCVASRRENAHAAHLSALNWLMSSRDRQRLRCGRLTLVWWHGGRRTRSSPELEATPVSSEGLDDLDRHTAAVLDALWAGHRPAIRMGYYNSEVCLLGLLTSTTRCSSVFFTRQTLNRLCHNVERWAHGLALVHDTSSTNITFGIADLVRSLTSGDDEGGHRQTKIATALIRAAVFGEKIWDKILGMAVRKLRSSISYRERIALTAIVKLTLMRNSDILLLPQLDPGCERPPYALGRLAAVLDFLQAFCDRSMVPTPSGFGWILLLARPAVGYPIALRTSRMYLRNLPGLQRPAFERALEEVAAVIGASGSPATLSDLDQGLFAVGYCHQNTVCRLSGFSGSRQDGSVQFARSCSIIVVRPEDV
jgi:CRISPR-associated protein Csd1